MTKNISDKKRILIFNKYDGRCAYCGIKLTSMHVDHIIPKQRGFTTLQAEKYNILKGNDNIDNLNPSCASCNISKGTFSIEQWRSELTLKVDRMRRDVSNFRLLEKFGIVKATGNDVIFYFEKHK
mgnify:CR=1 FL=1